MYIKKIKPTTPSQRFRIPANFSKSSLLKKSGKTGIFAGSLELVKEGNILIKQSKLFENIFIKENNE